MVRSELVLLCVLSLAGPAHAERYTLATLLGRVSEESPAIVAARAQLAARRAQLLEQQLRWLPAGEARLYVSSSPTVRCLSPSSPAGGDSESERLSHCVDTNVVDLLRGVPGADRSPFQEPLGNFSMALAQPLFTSSKISSAIGAARGGVGAAEAGVAVAQGDVAMTAVHTFAELKAARASLSTIDTGRGKLRDWLERSEKGSDDAKRSRFSEADRLRVRLALEDTRMTLLDQERLIEVSLEVLRALTGDPQADVDESERESDFQRRPVPSQAELHELMRRDRPEVRQGESGLFSLRQLRRLQGALALPDLLLLTGFRWGFASGLDIPTLAFVDLPPNAPGALLGLALHESLAFGVNLARWRQATLEERMQRQRFGLGLIYWTLELDKAWLDHREARERLALTTRAEQLTQAWYATIDRKLTNGAAVDGRDLVDVISSWMSSRLQRVNALRDAVVTLATLRRLSGQPILGPDGGLL